jgi:hypothetical protein
MNATKKLERQLELLYLAFQKMKDDRNKAFDDLRHSEVTANVNKGEMETWDDICRTMEKERDEAYDLLVQAVTRVPGWQTRARVLLVKVRRLKK